MNYTTIEDQARKMAEKAKPGFAKHGDNLYTMEFCQREWVYRVYENGFWFINFNVKTLANCKKELEKFLNS